MGNSGILSFATSVHGHRAYTSYCSYDPAAKELSIPTFTHPASPTSAFLASVLVGALVAAFIAAFISYPLMRLSDAAAVITTFAVLVIIHVVLVHWAVTMDRAPCLV